MPIEMYNECTQKSGAYGLPLCEGLLGRPGNSQNMRASCQEGGTFIKAGLPVRVPSLPVVVYNHAFQTHTSQIGPPSFSDGATMRLRWETPGCLSGRHHHKGWAASEGAILASGDHHQDALVGALLRPAGSLRRK